MVVIGSANSGVKICFNTQVIHVTADLATVGIEDKTILFKGEFVTLFKSVNREYSVLVGCGNNLKVKDNFHTFKRCAVIYEFATDGQTVVGVVRGAVTSKNSC